MIRAKVNYKGLPEHGRTLPVLGTRDFHGIAMVVLDSGGLRLALPADRVTILQDQTGEGAP